MRWWKSNLLLLSVALIIALAFAYRNLTDISTPGPSSIKQTKGVELDKQEVLIGVISRYAPATTYRTYQPLIDSLNQQSEYRYKLKLSKSYEETVDQIMTGEVGAAFLGSYIYAQARLIHSLQPVVAPLNKEGLPVSRSALVVPVDGPVKNINGLKGHSLALPSPSSFSGNWLNEQELKRSELSLSDLKEMTYFNYHHTVIFQILWGNFDAGVVRESVANEYLDQGIEVLTYSRPFPSAPLVMKKNANPRLFHALKQAMLRVNHINTPSAGKSFSHGFTDADDQNYAELSEWIQQTAGKNAR